MPGPVVFAVPAYGSKSAEQWVVRPGEPPLLIGQLQNSGETPDTTIEFCSAESVERFASGQCNPQEEVLRAEWRVSGSESLLLFVTEQLHSVLSAGGNLE